MLLAQLHQKLRREFEDMEDVVTSSVFVLLRYLPVSLGSCLLSRWADVPLQPDLLSVEFWPCYPTPAGFAIFVDASDRGDTEPDVVIRTGERLVLVEVKYRSHLDSSYDQQSREFAIGYRLAEQEGRRFQLLVVTADVLRPRPGRVELATGIRRALAEVQEAGGRVAEEMIDAVPAALRWIGWQQVYRAISRTAAWPDLAMHDRRLREDTRMLVALRGLRPYTEPLLALAMARWEQAGIREEAWQSPVEYAHRTSVSLVAGWRKLRELDVTRLHALPGASIEGLGQLAVACVSDPASRKVVIHGTLARRRCRWTLTRISWLSR